MRLNFTFETWSPDCSESEEDRQYCVRAIAVHEFGHALGLAHEHNRADTPDTCKEGPQGSNGNVYLGIWDKSSIMNYCNPLWSNGGALSGNDRAGIRTLYYPAAARAYCRGEVFPSPVPTL